MPRQTIASSFLAAFMVAALLFLPACGKRKLEIALVPTSDRLVEKVLERDPGASGHDKVVLINISGLIANSHSGGLLTESHNEVSDLREALNNAAEDDSVKAIILRLNTPGGTVTASDMIYREILAFKAKTHKPVIASMMDVCASGGFYISSAADYRIAYPTTITGSIGVIVQTLNFTGSLQKLGISAEAITSGPNKDVGNPFRPMNDNDRAVLRGFVTQFYGQFVTLVKETHPKVKAENWPMLTDGRVLSGTDAAAYGLVDQVGDLTDAVAAAKRMARLDRVQVISYLREEDSVGSIYAKSPENTPNASPQLNLLNINANSSDLSLALHPNFLYLWTGQ